MSGNSDTASRAAHPAGGSRRRPPASKADVQTHVGAPRGEREVGRDTGDRGTLRPLRALLQPEIAVAAGPDPVVVQEVLEAEAELRMAGRDPLREVHPGGGVELEPGRGAEAGGVRIVEERRVHVPAEGPERHPGGRAPVDAEVGCHLRRQERLDVRVGAALLSEHVPRRVVDIVELGPGAYAVPAQVRAGAEPEGREGLPGPLQLNASPVAPVDVSAEVVADRRLLSGQGDLVAELHRVQVRLEGQGLLLQLVTGLDVGHGFGLHMMKVVDAARVVLSVQEVAPSRLTAGLPDRGEDRGALPQVVPGAQLRVEEGPAHRAERDVPLVAKASPTELGVAVNVPLAAVPPELEKGVRLVLVSVVPVILGAADRVLRVCADEVVQIGAPRHVDRSGLSLESQRPPEGAPAQTVVVERRLLRVGVDLVRAARDIREELEGETGAVAQEAGELPLDEGLAEVVSLVG